MIPSDTAADTGTTGAGFAAAAAKRPPQPADSGLDERLDGLSSRARRLLRDAREAVERRQAGSADTTLERARASAGAHPEFWRLLGVVRHLQERYDEAIAAFRHALELKPADPIILTNMGTSLREDGQADAALATLRRACDLGPDLPATWHNLAQALNMLSYSSEANEAYARALACDPDYSRSRIGYAQTLNSLGRTAEAAEEFRRVLHANPNSMRTWIALANLKTVRLTVEETTWLDRLFASPDITDQDRIPLGFALAKALEDQGRYDEAFTIYASTNALKRRSVDWSAVAFSRHVDAIAAAFATPPRPAASKTLGREVIFIVSLPRSGSTLTEQILASHPDVEGANELRDMQDVLDEECRRRDAEFPDWVTRAKAADWQRLGNEYMERTERWRTSRKRFTDKSLGTWRYLGAAAAMLPGARFVNVRRDPVETCLSCFRQVFGKGHAYCYDLTEMAAYWRDYDRLTRFWNSRYPHLMHDFGYEALLANPEVEVRRLLEFCELPFDAACLKFYDTERNVRTVSAAQVREPLRSDTARAANYGELLAPLRRSLAQGRGETLGDGSPAAVAGNSGRPL